jgi:hypothetical protein
VALWRNAAGFTHLGPVLPERAGGKVLRVAYDGPTLTSGVGFQVRIAERLRVRAVHADGKRLKPAGAGDPYGHASWHDGRTTFAVAAVPRLEPGEHEISFTFR